MNFSRETVKEYILIDKIEQKNLTKAAIIRFAKKYIFGKGIEYSFEVRPK